MSDTTGKKNESAGKNKGNLLSDLLTNENLDYNLPSSATVIVQKSQKLFFCDRTEYKSGDDRMVITLNSGSDMIDGLNSYLAFKLTAVGNVGTGKCYFGSGSAANVFSEIVIRSRDGAEVERIRDLNSLMLTRTRWSNAQDYINNKASESGYLSDLTDNVKTYTVAQTTAQLYAGQDYVIPMRDMSALFNVEKLLPSFLMSGLRIEFVLAPVATVFITSGDSTATSYTISNPVMRLETLKVSDSVMNQLTQNAANGGLVLQIDTWDLTKDTISGTQCNIEVRRNVSQVLGVLVKTRLTASTTAAALDSLASEPDAKVKDYRFRLGSQFIPNTKIESKVEMYSLAQIAWNKFKLTAAENSISLKDYLENGQSIISSDLERSAIDLSGVSISNSKVLAFEATMDDAVDRTMSVWVNFTRALTVFLTNTLVED